MPTPEPEKRVKRPRLRLPFEKRKQDAGSWTYDHRIGLCVTLIAYLVLMIAFVSSKIVVGRKPHTQGMYIDLQTLAELEQERDRLERLARERQEQDPIDWRSIQNQVSNENALNEKLRDDRGTNAAALNDAAAAAEERMRANREAYEQGLAEERAIRCRGGFRAPGSQGQGARHGLLFADRPGADVPLPGRPGLQMRRRRRSGGRDYGQPCGRRDERPGGRRRGRVHALFGARFGPQVAFQHRRLRPGTPARDDYVYFYPPISSFCPAEA